jgi:protein STE50
MAFPTGAAYHADSDADDEYERSVITSPTQIQFDSEGSPTDSEPPSNEHTPTIFDMPGEDQTLPRSIMTEWTAEESAQFIASFGLRQYCDAFIGMDVHVDVEAALTAMCRERHCRRGITSAQA